MVEPAANVKATNVATGAARETQTNVEGAYTLTNLQPGDSTSPGFLRSSSFGRPVTTAGGVFGSGGPRAFQFAARVIF